MITIRMVLDEKDHVLHLYRPTKFADLVLAKIALDAQAETLVKRAIQGTGPSELSDADCWLLATGTEFTDPAF